MFWKFFEMFWKFSWYFFEHFVGTIGEVLSRRTYFLWLNSVLWGDLFVSKTGYRPPWGLQQSPSKGRKRKLSRSGDKVKIVDFKFEKGKIGWLWSKKKINNYNLWKFVNCCNDVGEDCRFKLKYRVLVWFSESRYSRNTVCQCRVFSTNSLCTFKIYAVQ